MECLTGTGGVEVLESSPTNKAVTPQPLMSILVLVLIRFPSFCFSASFSSPTWGRHSPHESRLETGDWRLKRDGRLAVGNWLSVRDRPCRDAGVVQENRHKLSRSNQNPFLETPRVHSGLGMSHNCRDWPDSSPSDWCQACHGNCHSSSLQP